MIVVTGGAGFIGSNLIAALAERGLTDVAVCDRLGRDKKWRNLAKRELRAFVFPERLPAYLDDHAGEVEAVFHLGAISSTMETDADLVVDTNFSLSIALWDWCARHDVPLIYASSAATYGDGAAGFDDDGSLEGLARLRPLNAYGWSKHVFDRWVARALREDRPAPPQWAGLKFFNVYGPNELHKGEMMSLVSKLTPRLAAGEPARLFKSYRSDYADGGQLRDFIFVDDCVAVMLWLFDNPAVSGLFNCGTGAARSFAALARAVFAALGREPKLDFIEMPEPLRPAYQYYTQAETGRLRQAGFARPFTSLEEGVGRTVRDHLVQPDPYR